MNSKNKIKELSRMPKCKVCKSPLNSKTISTKMAKYLYDKDLMIKCYQCGRRYRIDIEFHFVLSLFIAVLSGYMMYVLLNHLFSEKVQNMMYIPSFTGSSLLFYLLGINGSIIATVEEWKTDRQRKKAS